MMPCDAEDKEVDYTWVAGANSLEAVACTALIGRLLEE